MSPPVILHCNLRRATLDAIQASFGATYKLIQVDAAGDIAVKGRKEHVALVVIGADNNVIMLPENLNAPTVVIAQQHDMERELQALEAGAADYCSDATPMPVLMARLRKLLSGRISELSQDLSFALRHFEQQDRANYLYYHDVLTGLPNFLLFLDRLTQAIDAANGRELGVYVVVANLENFKHVNEVWGRLAGDQVLEIIAQRLRTGLPEQANIARITGDSFAIAGLYSDHADLTLLIDRVTEIIDEPIQRDGHTLQLSVRMGCATSPQDGDEGEMVCRNAEAALKPPRYT